MKNYFQIVLAILVLVQLSACKDDKETLVLVDEVAPWCIVGFDSMDRTPQERIAMLNELGLKKYGFNRGKAEFGIMKEEFALAKENDIEITSVFVWLNAKRDSIGKLSDANQELLNNLKEVDQKPPVWVSFSDNYFEKIDDAASIKLAAEMIKSIKSTTDKIGCQLALYNHNGWFGNPMNQIEIMKALDDSSITMVYNFHHGQEYVDDFNEIAKKIRPYLSYVNLNGVKKDGPKIMPIGQGDHEYDMIKILKQEGYKGPWGILGHVKTEDVKKVLEGNMEGLNRLNEKYANE